MSKRRVHNTSILYAQKEVERARKHLTNSIFAAIALCDHKSIGECEYLHNDFMDSSPPARVCLDCGLVEEGWSAGYLVLQSLDLIKLSREELWSLRTVTIVGADKGPLLRKEQTLMDIVGLKLGIVNDETN